MDFSRLFCQDYQQRAEAARSAYEKKRVLCCLSGGLDSTYMVYQFLRLGYHVDPLYVEITNNAAKVAREEVALKAIMNTFEDAIERGELPGKLSGVERISVSVSCCKNLFFKQVLPFLSSLASSVDVNAHEMVAIGYVMNDDAISYLDDIRAVWKSFDRIAKSPMPELAFPNAKITKNVILEYLPAKFMQHVTWCEYGEPGDMKFCGDCPACRRAEGHRGRYEQLTGTRHKTRKELRRERMTGIDALPRSESESLTEA